MTDVLATLEAYFDEVPRAGAAPYEVGPFTVFVSRSTAYPYYARPRLGLATAITADDVRAVVRWQAGRGQPGALEWVQDVTPSLAAAVAGAGLHIERHPLLVLSRARRPGQVPGVALRTVGADDPQVPWVRAAVGASFEAPAGEVRHDGSERSTAGRDAAHAQLDPEGLDRLCGLIRDGQLVMIGAFDDAAGAVGGGTHGPRDDVTELTGIGVLPAFRRRGLGAAVTGALVDDALARGVRTVCLSAQDDDVARVYGRVGFVRVGHAAEAH